MILGIIDIDKMQDWTRQYFRQERIILLSAKMGGGSDYRPKGVDASLRRISDQKQIDVSYVIAGEGEYLDKNGKLYSITPGCFFKRVPGEIHSTRVTACPYCELYFSLPNEIYVLLKNCHSPIVACPRVMDLGLHQSIAKNHALLVQKIKNAYEPMIPELIFQIILFCNSFLATRTNEYHQLIQRACSLIDCDLSCRTSLHEIAAQVGMGYQNFRKLFHQQTGTSPGEYRIKRRIERAYEMLAKGIPQKQIAAQLGYSDVQGFSRQFRERMGVSPGGMAKQICNQGQKSR